MSPSRPFRAYKSAIVHLTVLRCSQISVERAKMSQASDGSLVGAMAQRLIDRSFLDDLKDAHQWTLEAIKVLRAAPDAHWDDDESAAQAIIDQLRLKHPELVD